MDRYARQLDRDRPAGRIAVVGAGLAGLLCARTLHDHRHEVTLFDKGRQPGGRSSARGSRTDPSWSFDHGVPYFEARDRRVRRLLLSWEDAGALQRWAPVVAPGAVGWSEDAQRFVGVPSSQALGLHLAADLPQHMSTRITGLEHRADGWFVQAGEAVYGPYDTVVLNLPVPQLLALFPPLEGRLSLPASAPAHTLMMRFAAPLHVGWDAARPDHPVLEWVCREASKPGRPDLPQWTVQSRAAWSVSRLQHPPEEVERELLAAFLAFVGADQSPVATQLHRWLYARSIEPLPEGSFWDPALGLGVCGDAWGGDVEGALLSGAHLAGSIMRQGR